MNDKTIDDVRQIVNNVKATFQAEHEKGKTTFETMMHKISGINTFVVLWEEYKLRNPENIYRQAEILQAQYDKVVEQNRQLQQELNYYKEKAYAKKL